MMHQEFYPDTIPELFRASCGAKRLCFTDDSIETIKAIEERSKGVRQDEKNVENLTNLLETARRWSYELLQRNET
jgi:hypothetical protein